ncbi:MAG: hypothetical protein ACM3PV_01045 [Betaproteobacteria bacterium]
MSLILDALRKLERDKERPDPGVVVLGPAPWPGLRSSRRGWIVGLLAAAAVLAAAFTWLARARTPGPVASSVPVASSASPAPMPPARAPQAVAAAATPLSGAPATRAADLGPPTGRRLVLPDSGPGRDAAAGGLPTPRSVPKDLQLMAISERDGRPIAIVSDHLVREGDSFDGVKIVRIGETEVEVEQHGRRRVLRF